MIRIVSAVFLTLCIYIFAQQEPRAQFNGCPAGFCSLVAPAGGGGATTTFDSSKNNGTTLSGGSLVATYASGANAWVLSVAGHSTGKYYMEVTATAYTGHGFPFIGIASASHSTANYCGQDTNSSGMNNTHTWYFNASPTSLGAVTWDLSVGNVFGLEFDAGTPLVKWQNWSKSSGWGSSGTLGSLIGGPWYVCVGEQTSGDILTANFGGSAYTGTPEAGFGTNW